MTSRVFTLAVIGALSLSATAISQVPQTVTLDDLSDEGREAVILCASSIGALLPAICDEVIRQDFEGPALSYVPGRSLKAKCDAIFQNTSRPESIACRMRAFTTEALAKLETDGARNDQN